MSWSQMESVSCQREIRAKFHARLTPQSPQPPLSIIPLLGIGFGRQMFVVTWQHRVFVC